MADVDKPLDRVLTSVMPGICSLFDTMGRRLPLKVEKAIISPQVVVEGFIRIRREVIPATEHEDMTIVDHLIEASWRISHQAARSSVVSAESSQVIPSEPTRPAQSKMLYDSRPEPVSNPILEIDQPWTSKTGSESQLVSKNDATIQKSAVGDEDEAIRMLLFVDVANRQWLKTVDACLNQLGGKRKEKDINTLRGLRHSLIEYMKKIDNIFLAYTVPHANRKSKLNIGDILESKKKLNRIIGDLRTSKIHDCLPDHVDLDKDDFTASALGLNETLTDRLKNMDIEHRWHEPVDYHIKDYCMKTILNGENHRNMNTKELLCKSGLTESTAELLSQSFESSEFKDAQNLWYWVEEHIDERLRNDVLISNPRPRYPYQEYCTDKWLVEKIEDFPDEESDEDSEMGTVKLHDLHFFNCSNKIKDVPRPINEVDLATTESHWFHGTDHESAMSIIVEGVRLRNGKPSQDFSDRDGFNMYEKLSSAKKWASLKDRPAVIVFKKLDVSKYNGLDLSSGQTNDKRAWREIVKYNRREQEKRWVPGTDLRKKFEECDFVYGPCSSDGGLVTMMEGDDLDSWQPLGYNRPGQACTFCVRSQTMALALADYCNIECVLFF